MTSDPDKLFRDKLRNYQRPAPPAAWERIERNVSKTKPLNTRMKIAAAILLLVAAGYVMWPKSVSVETAYTVNDQKEIIQPGETINDEKENIKSEEVKTIISPEPNRTNSLPPNAFTKSSTVKKKVNVVTEEIKTEERIEQMTAFEFGTEEPSIATTSVDNKDLSLKIVYSNKEVNARFLKEKIAPELLVRKDTLPITRSPGLAYAIKHSEIGIGDLRQIKNEILALDFLAHNEKNNKSTNR